MYLRPLRLHLTTWTGAGSLTVGPPGPLVRFGQSPASSPSSACARCSSPALPGRLRPRRAQRRRADPNFRRPWSSSSTQAPTRRDVRSSQRSARVSLHRPSSRSPSRSQTRRCSSWWSQLAPSRRQAPHRLCRWLTWPIRRGGRFWEVLCDSSAPIEPPPWAKTPCPSYARC